MPSGQPAGRGGLPVDTLRVGEGVDKICDETRGTRNGHPLFGHRVRVGGPRSMSGSMPVDDWEMKWERARSQKAKSKRTISDGPPQHFIIPDVHARQQPVG